MNNAYKILDIVLRQLKDSSREQPVDMYKTLLDKFKLNPRDNRSIIEKLVKDGYVENIILYTLEQHKSLPPSDINSRKFLPDKKYQYITFDGLIFIENGGYLQKNLSEIQEKSDKKKLEERLAKSQEKIVYYQKNMNRIQWFVIASLFITCSYYGIEIYKFCKTQNSPQVDNSQHYKITPCYNCTLKYNHEFVKKIDNIKPIDTSKISKRTQHKSMQIKQYHPPKHN